MNILKKRYSLPRGVLSILLVLMVGTVGSAQQPPREKLESARIALITKRLSLTPEDAQQFWPVYNQMSQKRAALKREGFRLRRAANTESMTDEQAHQQLTHYFDLKKKELALEEETTEKLMSILSPVQVLQLLKAEQDFHRMMLKQLGRRGRGRGRAYDSTQKYQRTRLDPKKKERIIKDGGVSEGDIF